ncbi:LPD7 domain-containing protein [uncultured Roseobacter sp.]|uniref:LPD7 domain-containing protein n=1 Tax=uncultured Roseobacter sp. TaxID=114847 RepID=UPI0026397E61|nr:LPD7 domain-containing protein [uncultured Roseobacter sp.]
MSETDANDDLSVLSKDIDTQAPEPLDRDIPVELQEPAKDKEKPENSGDLSTPTKPDDIQEGSVEPDAPQPAMSREDRFALPTSFENRFILTREANRQEMYRAYDDMRPAISDHGDRLHTRNADRSTAMDMIELAAHRGWSSMKVRGPEDFRREMWIEATAQGIRVQGYRPNDKDRAEADRRAELMGERVIERTDQGNRTNGMQHGGKDQSGNPENGASNVVPMIDYQKGIEGTITGIGAAPYRDRDGASSTPYVVLELADGRAHKLWGVALPDMINRDELKVGDKATIYDDGRKAVTVKSRDPKTGEEREIQTFRREWGARDIDRAASQEKDRVEPVQKRDDAVLVTIHPDRLEDRLKEKDAADDPKLRGAASILAKLDAEMRAADVPEKDRATVRDLAASELAKGIREGRLHDVRKLPNVRIAQQMAAKTLSPKDVSRIIEQARVKNATGRQASAKGNGEMAAKDRERSTQTDHGRER